MRTISAFLVMSFLLGCSKQAVTQPSTTFAWNKADQQISKQDIVRENFGPKGKERK